VVETTGVIKDLVELKEKILFGSTKEKEEAKIKYDAKLTAFKEVSKDLMSAQHDILTSAQENNLDNFRKRFGG
jgi:hypothetical protein